MDLKKTPKADLQNKKTLFFEIGLALSLLVLLVAFNWTSSEKIAGLLVSQHQEIVEEEEQVPITQQEPPPPPEIPKIPQIPDVIDIVDDDVDILSEVDFSESESNDNLFNDLAYVEKKQQVVATEEEVDEVIPFAIVEEKPKFQGKDAGEFVKWIYAKLDGNYPQAAAENNIQGTVRISFTVNVDGSLSDIKSIRKADPLLEDCVIEIVKKSPKWTPGRQQQKPVKVTYQVPVHFKLQN
jgi:protein TonB